MKCLRKTKFICLLFSLWFCGVFFVLSSSASAYNFENSGLRPIYYIALSNNAGGYTSSTPAIQYTATVNAPNAPSGAVLNAIDIYTPGGQGFPASSIVNFSVRMLVPGYANNFEFSGFGALSNGSLLDQQCTTSATYGNNLIADMTCTLWVYFPSYTEHTLISSNIRYRAAGLNVTISGAGVLTISDSEGGGISEADLAEQIDRLTRLIPQQVDRLVTPYILAQQIDRITVLLQTQEDRSVTAIEDNTDAVNNPDYIQQEKDDLEDQKQESSDTANDESSEAQDTATSLLDVIIQAIGVFSSAEATNCNLDGNLIPHLPLGNLNLCEHSPPPAITALGSILLIGFVVPLAYHLVKRMLALIGSFQS